MRAKHVLPALILLLAAPLAAQVEVIPGEWRRIGPDGGIVTELTVAPSNPGVVYAGTLGAFYRSLDGGASWAFQDDDGVSPVQPTVDAANPFLVYAQLASAVRSRDGGGNWEVLKVPGAPIRQLVAHPRIARTVFAATAGRIFQSTDAGSHWKALRGAGLPNGFDPFRLVVDPVSPRRMYLLTQEENFEKWFLFKSLDGGFSWQAMDSSFIPPGNFVVALITHPRSSRILFAAVNHIVFKSTDGGASWKSTLARHDAFMQGLLIPPGQPNVVYAPTGNGLFRSLDGGATWRRSEGLSASSHFRQLALSGSRLVASISAPDRREGVYRSEDGGLSWIFSSRGLTSLDVTAVDFGAPGTVWAVASTFLFRTTDDGLSWSRIRPDRTTTLGPAAIAVAPSDRSNVFVLYTDGAVWRSHDAGRTWEAAGNAGLWTADLAIDPQTPSTLYASGVVAGNGGGGIGTIAKSTDGGATWTALPVERVFYDDVDIAPSSPSTLYAAGHLENSKPVLQRSTDGGATWTRLSFDGQGTNRATLAVDPLVATTLYTFDQGYLYRSADGGATWSQAARAMNGNPAYPLAISDSGRVYAAVWAVGVTAYEDGNPPGGVLGNILPWGFNVLAHDPHDPCRLYAGPLNRSLFVFRYTGTAGCPAP